VFQVVVVFPEVSGSWLSRYEDEGLIAEDIIIDHVLNLRRETKEWGVRSVELGAIISQLSLSEKTKGTGESYILSRATISLRDCSRC
jgi:hypothetical protein